MSKNGQASTPSRLIDIVLDQSSIGSHSHEAEHERKVAIFDLLEDNSFELVDGPQGPYKLRIGIAEQRLALAVTVGEARRASSGLFAFPQATAQGRERLFSRLRELLRGDQVGPARPDRGARHGPARAPRRGQQAPDGAPGWKGPGRRAHVAAPLHAPLRVALERLARLAARSARQPPLIAGRIILLPRRGDPENHHRGLLLWIFRFAQ